MERMNGSVIMRAAVRMTVSTSVISCMQPSTATGPSLQHLPHRHLVFISTNVVSTINISVVIITLSTITVIIIFVIIIINIIIIISSISSSISSSTTTTTIINNNNSYIIIVNSSPASS